MDTAFGDMEQVISDMLLEISMSAQRRNLVFPVAMITAGAVLYRELLQLCLPLSAWS